MEEYLAIIERFKHGLINYKEAFEELKALPKAWTTKHWQDLRKKHLKDSCENCGTSEGIMVIQHTKQPTKFTFLFHRIMDSYVAYEAIKLAAEQSISDEDITKHLEETAQVRESCPVCGLVSVRLNKKENIYICSKQHRFEKPNALTYYSKARTTDVEAAKASTKSFLSYITTSKMVREKKQQYDLEVGRQALLISINEGLEYRNFKHIKTCCKRCAAIEDSKYIGRQ
jgi:hypothetical protein